MVDYNIAMEQRLDVNDSDLSKDLAMVELWNNLTVVDEDTEFFNKYNRVISDGSIPNVEDNNKTYNEEREDIYINLKLFY